jgi:hypothetical protein
MASEAHGTASDTALRWVVLSNLLRTAFLAFPLFWCVVAIQFLIEGGSRPDWLEWLFTAAYFWFSFLVPVLVGSMLHQGLTLLFRGRSQGVQRGGCVLLSPIVLVPLVVLGMPEEPLGELAPSIALGLLIYSFLLRLPRST